MRPFAPGFGKAHVLCVWFLVSIALRPCTAQVGDASPAELVKQMQSKDVDVRRDAAYELVRRLENSPPAIEALAQGLSDRDSQVRFQSLLGLARVGDKAAAAIPQLIDCLDDRDDQVRFRAADALGKIGKAAIEPLLEVWTNAGEETRVAVVRSLSIMGPRADSVGDFLTEALQDESADVRRYAAEAVAAVMPEAAEILLRLAEHEDAQVRKKGVVALAALESPSPEVIQRLQHAAADDDEKVRETAVIALAKSKLSPGKQADFIEAGLLDDAASVRFAAIAAIRKAQLDPEKFAARIASQLAKAPSGVGNSLIKALSELGPPAKIALPQLLDVSTDASLDADLLAETIAGFDFSIVSDLLSILETKPELEALVASSLAIIGEPAVDALLAGMTSPNETIRKSSTRALGRMQPMKRKWLEAIVARVSDSSPEVRQVAISAIVAAGCDAEFASQIVLAATTDSSDMVREAALSGLAVFDYSPESLEETVRRGLGDDSPDVRISSLEAIAKIKDAADRFLPQLLQVMADSDANVRQVAIETLAHIDLDSVNAKRYHDELISAVVAALQDDNPAVRTEATSTSTRLSLSDPAVLAALADNLADDLDLLLATLEALRQFGSQAKSLAPTVSQLIDHPAEAVRIAAVKTYANLQADHQILTGRLTEALADSEWAVRQTAGEALGELGPDAKAAIPTLFRLLSSEEDSDFARGAIREIDAAPVEALPLLVEGMESEDRRTSYYAIFLLGKIGPPAAEVLPKLEARLAETDESDRSEYRRRYLVQAIASIKGEPVNED